MRSPRSRYKLVVAEGAYESDSLLGLLKLMMSHRFEHWRKGEGWVD